MALGVVFLVSVAAQAQVEVKTVPWVPNNPLIPHDTWSGKAITLKGTTNLTNGTWTWDFGDGSAVATGSIDTQNRHWLQATHTYTGAPGTVHTARLIVESGEETATSYYYVAIQSKTLAVEVNVAIDEGLWYLHRTMYRYESGGLLFGNWTACTNAHSSCGYATSGFYGLTATNLNAFLVNGHLEGGSPDNPYTETVQRAMRQLLLWLTPQIIGIQTNPLGTFNPDMNGNGIGLAVNQTYPYYQGGMFICALVASGSPHKLAETGPLQVLGRRYEDIVQDLVDQYAWAQYDTSPGGGWRYTANSSPDNSTSHWAALGLIAAEGFGGVTVPQPVKDWNRVWLAYTQATSGAYPGAFGYTSTYDYVWGPYATTASGMLQLAMDNVGRGTNLSASFAYPAWDWAETFIRNNFENTGNAYTSIRDYYYALFTFVKAMLLHDDPATPGRDPLALLVSTTPGVEPLDWYGAETPAGVARTVVGDQTPAGYWYGHDQESTQFLFETAFAIMMLSRSAFESGGPVAVATAVPNPAVAGQTISLSGASSFHQDPSKSIVEWRWDLDDDGQYDDATGVTAAVSFPALGDYPVGLQVEDDAGTVADTTIVIAVEIPPLAPTAEAGGPYSFQIGPATMTLDGTGSVNPDEGQSEPDQPPDTITLYEWDLDGDGQFDDATGSQPDVTDFFTAVGPGSYLIYLRVTDNTAESFPSSGQPNLADTDTAGVVVTVASDTTPPELQLPLPITAEAASAAGAVVVYQATATDDVDGSVTPVCTPPSGGVFPLGVTTVLCTATDSTGNSATASFTITVVDTTPPEVTAPADVQATVTGALTPVDLGVATAFDLVDGDLVAVPSDPGPFSPGTHTITWTATDSHGNVGTDTQQVVLHYAIGAFQPPIQPLPATNEKKAGSVVTVKWRISNGSGGFIRDLSAVVALMYAETACDAVTYATAIGAEAAGGSGLHYDMEADQFVFNWKTDPALSDRCAIFILRLADGTEHLARFSFR